MQRLKTGLPAIVAMAMAASALAQGEAAMQNDEMKISALEALITAPPDRALPIVSRVLRGDHSDEVKESALFVLSQVDTGEARALLLDTARNSTGELQVTAIQMIGIAGDDETLAALRPIYGSGDRDVRDAVFDAYMIASDHDALLELALAADNPEDLEAAVEALAAIGAIEELREVRNRSGASEMLIQAYAVAGDFETLREMALDGSNPDDQVEAIGALGIIGSPEATATLLQMYRDSDDWDVKEAAIEGMMIADYDDGIIELYRASSDADEKEELFEYLRAMGSEHTWEVVEETLQDD